MPKHTFRHVDSTWQPFRVCLMALAFSELFILLREAAMAIDRGNETTTQLLTLLNVSATKAGKRKWILDDARPSEKLNKRRNVQFGDASENENGDRAIEQPPDEAIVNSTAMEAEEETHQTEDDEETTIGMLCVRS